MAARKTRAEGDATGLGFEAKLAGVKPVMAKRDEFSGRTSGGRLELTLSIDQPQPPEIPYQFHSRSSQGARWAPAPTIGNFGHIKDAEKQQAEFESARRHYEEAKAKYERQVAAYGPRAVAYAQLAGLTVVLGNQLLRVTMEPIGDSGMLPGFGAQLLPAPADEDDGSQDDD